MDRFRPRYALGVVVVLLAAATAHAAGTPGQRCQASKNIAAGKYVACRDKTEARLVTSRDLLSYGHMLAKCTTRFTHAWQKADAKAAAAGSTCLDAPLTTTDFGTVIDEHTDNITTALAGGGLGDCQGGCAAEGPPGRRLATGQTECSNSDGRGITCAGTGHDGALQKGLSRIYNDNGDGTITDARTGLMWEKLSDDSSVHDLNNTYTWQDAFAAKMAALNGGSGFAGYTDWRVPNVNELQSLVSYEILAPAVGNPFNTGCAPGCAVTTCSCTGPDDLYWSSTTYQELPSLAFLLIARDGVVGAGDKPSATHVRAVRGS